MAPEAPTSTSNGIAKEEGGGAARSRRAEIERGEGRAPDLPLQLRAENVQRPHVEKDVIEAPGVEERRGEQPPPLPLVYQQVALGE